jgi:hypothetical protein
MATEEEKTLTKIQETVDLLELMLKDSQEAIRTLKQPRGAPRPSRQLFPVTFSNLAPPYCAFA